MRKKDDKQTPIHRAPSPGTEPREGVHPGVASGRTGHRKSLGFTLMELMAVLALLGILSTIAIKSSLQASQSTKNKTAVADILEAQTLIDEFAMRMDRLPHTLDEVGAGDMRDPWGNAYVYVPFAQMNDTNIARKDRFLVPINTLYDLYSMGADGRSSRPLSNSDSLDDVVRANDGAFVGLAAGF